MSEKHTITIKKSKVNSAVVIQLPASKSIANRAIVVNALSEKNAELQNMSNARDTELMLSLFNSQEEIINVKDAGTTMRFLTAFFAVKNSLKIIKGTERMHNRPIGILVNALNTLGAGIEYLGKEGYPPLKTNGFQNQNTDQLTVDAGISSQYISALMMIGPVLPKGLNLSLSGKIGSRPYIEMTAQVMKSFGGKVDFTGNTIRIQPGGYKGTENYVIEPDWSAASYWYSLIAIQKQGEITLSGLKPESIQGDSVIAKIMEEFGVRTTFTSAGAMLSYSGIVSEQFEYDFTDCPDLAQTVAVTSAATGIKAYMSGLESLRIKETDRILALQNELAKMGAKMILENDKWVVSGNESALPSVIEIETYEDHRMAMAFMPLCSLTSVRILAPEVTAKSYPHFWDDTERALISV